MERTGGAECVRQCVKRSVERVAHQIALAVQDEPVRRSGARSGEGRTTDLGMPVCVSHPASIFHQGDTVGVAGAQECGQMLLCVAAAYKPCHAGADCTLTCGPMRAPRLARRRGRRMLRLTRHSDPPDITTSNFNPLNLI